MNQPSSRNQGSLNLEQAPGLLTRLAQQAEASGDARAATILLNTASLLRDVLPPCPPQSVQVRAGAARY